MNALDLAKVGKAFGFAVPPRINVDIGGGKGGTGKSGKKRRVEEDVEEDDDEDEEVVKVPKRDQGRDKGKKRRIETLGRRKVEKEVYRKEMRRQKEDGGQWSR